MSMTVQDLAAYVREHCPAKVGIIIALQGEKDAVVEMIDSRNVGTVKASTFHVEECRDLEACVLDALSHAQAEVAA